MNERMIEIEADSLNEAESQLYKSDFLVLEKFVLCNGKVDTIKGVADTVEEALTKARSGIPVEARIETQEIKIAPKRFVLQAQGETEESAKNEIGLKKDEVIESVSLQRKGRKGILGFFKTLNVYEVAVFQQAVVEIGFRAKARIRAKVQGYSGKDLLIRVEEVRRRGAQWTESLRLLNPKKDSQVQELLIGFRDRLLSDTHTMLNYIEDVCHKNDRVNWKTAISEASCARARELEIKRIELIRLESERIHKLEQRRITLRKLDHKIAEGFKIYTSLNWDKRYSKLTGIRKWNYDHHRPPDERERETIPRYSSEEEAFRRLLNRVSSLHVLYLKVLAEEGRSEATASVEQKCMALLEAQRRS